MMIIIMIMMNCLDFYSKEKGILQTAFSGYLNLYGQNCIHMSIISV